MSFLRVVPEGEAAGEATGEVRAMYEQAAKAHGFVPKVKAFASRPDARYAELDGASRRALTVGRPISGAEGPAGQRELAAAAPHRVSGSY